MASEIQFETDNAGVTEAEGFYAAAGHADVRRKQDNRLDLGLLYSRIPCAAAGVFTVNAVKAAPVLECQRILALEEPIHGVVANSGNANACTGAQGLKDATAMIRAAEEACGAPKDTFLVCSTGRIGEQMPIDPIKASIRVAAQSVKQGTRVGSGFAQSILTSDTKPKTCSASFKVGGKTVVVGGAAKGAGMIQPNMATMLAFITTDIHANAGQLQAALAGAVKRTFNAITVDGDMSTNDTVLLLANGESGAALDEGTMGAFEDALYQVCDCLADKIVSDGERISKVVEVLIQGAASEDEAELAARAIGNSLLVKASWFGNDPNWGRLMDALGYSGARLDPDSIDINYDSVQAVAKGMPLPKNKPLWKEVVSKKRFAVKVDLHQGSAAFRLKATDLTEGYVNFNKSE